MLKAELPALAQLSPNVVTNHYLSRLGRFLDSRRCVHAVAIQITVSGHCNIRKVNTDSQSVRATRFGRPFVVPTAQNRSGGYFQLRAWKFGEHGVTQEFDYSPVVSRYDFASEGLKDFN